MFQNTIPLPFRLLGIPVLLDWSFLIFLPVLAWLITGQIGQAETLLPPWLFSGPAPDSSFILGAICAIGLFTSVLIHELGHSIVARAYGIEVISITLWLLGGMARFKEMPQERGREAVIAIAGPLTSAALFGVCLAAQGFGDFDSAAVRYVLAYLALMNLLLAAFNLLPALPLDGGRVLRSLLALRIGYLRATVVSTSVSTTMAVALGLFAIISGHYELILIAFFIVIAGRSESSAIQVRTALRDLRVGEVMSARVDPVYAHHSIRDLVARMIATRRLAFPVLDIDGSLVGLVTPKELEHHGVEEPSQDDRQIRQIMQTPAPTIGVAEPVVRALDQMTESGLDRVAVVDSDGLLVGMLSTTDITRAMQIRLLAGG